MSFDALITRLGASAVSIKTYAHIASYDGILQPAPVRGADVLVPARMGQQWTAQTYDAYTFSVPLILLGSSLSTFQDSLSGLKQLVESSRQSVVFSRQVPRTGGDLTTSCRSRVRVAEVAMVNDMITGRVALEVTNLDGCWYGTSAAMTVSGIGQVKTVSGDAPTNRMTIVLPGAGELHNGATGTSIIVTAGATLDVEAQSTTGSLADVVTAGDPFGAWFALAPGSNVMTWTGSGSASITYNPAYQ